MQAFAELCLGHLLGRRLGQRCHHRPHRAYDYERIRYALGGAPHLRWPHPRRHRRQDRRVSHAGVENILALRGDLPAGATEDDKPASDYAYARDLIPELVDAGFCVGAAAYPEGHIACEDLNASVEYLKQKQDAGASFFVTQLFFDNECFYRFRELADKAGITVPITAGIMPFMGKSQISRMVFMCGASLPSPVIKILAKYENDPESLQAAGVDYAAHQLCDLKEHGADGLHLYTMNRPAIAATIMERLG